jgi:hypothetical protein
MGGVKDALFGSTKMPKVKQMNMYTEGQNELLNSLVEILNNQLGGGVDSYGGQLVPGESDIQSLVFGKAEDILGRLGQDGTGYGDSTRQVIERLLSGGRSMDATTPGAVATERNQFAQPYDSEADMDYWNKAFVNPAMKTWEERIAPQVREKFIAQNIASSSGANNAISRSAGDLMTNLSGQLAGIMQGNKQTADTRAFTGEENFLNRLLSTGEAEAGREMTAQGLNAQLGENALSRLLQVPGFEATLRNVEDPTQQLLNMLGIGTEQRNIEGQGMSEDYTKWLQSQAYTNPWLQLLGMTGGTSPFQLSTQAGSQQSGIFQDILAPLMSGVASKTGTLNPLSWFK